MDNAFIGIYSDVVIRDDLPSFISSVSRDLVLLFFESNFHGGEFGGGSAIATLNMWVLLTSVLGLSGIICI